MLFFIWKTIFIFVSKLKSSVKILFLKFNKRITKFNENRKNVKIKINNQNYYNLMKIFIFDNHLLIL